MVGEEKRHQMMQNLFGDQSEEEEEEEVESEHESNRQTDYASDEGDGGLEPEGEGEAEIEGQGEAEVESEGELREVDHDPGESEGERDQSSQEVEVDGQREESEGKESESDEKEQYGQRVVTSRRRDVIESGSEKSEEHHYADNEDEEVDQARSPRSPVEEKDETHTLQSAPEIRDVFGDSDEEEPAEYTVQNKFEEDSIRSPMEDEGSYGRGLRPEDMVPDEDMQYESEEENIEAKIKEKPVGPPLELEIPFRPPPAHPDKMNMIKVSNIMGIDPKPFDPKTYEEEDIFVTDESGSNKRIRLDNNIVRWRIARKPDGTESYESNARFVRWSDGSLQLLIGNEVLDISVQDAQHDQAHLFLRHGKGILQSQGRLLRKMRFMPSSLTSNSHRLLTALVDSRHKKVYRVKNCVTDIDPEREKERKEKAESQTIRANELLNRKKEKVNRKYTQTVRRERQLSPGFLEDALDEDDEPDYYESRRSSARHRFEEDLEMEARAEKRIINAKKPQLQKDTPRKSSLPPVKSARRPIDFSESEREESEYETEGEEVERFPPGRRVEEPEQEHDEEEPEHDEDEAETNETSEEELEEPKHGAKEFGGSLKSKEIQSDEDSPPRKMPTHRRMAIVYDSDEE
ncbi:protein LEO1 homolog isoform X2 [Actinidia eriantha]|uniref:protein LEO1 homolog isoform X2 n=1 Tax=Actinidia eriantha TaxID=165200 RepID=UPI002583229F|nr:protein LEO1 homolog isoform X2 [Actinidia eriantha]